MATPRPRLERFLRELNLWRAMLVIVTVSVTLTFGGAVLARAVEPEAFETFGQAVWWALQTVSTVGYGDVVPTTTGGRAVGTVLILLGVALVPAVTSIVVAALVSGTRLGESAGSHAEVIERLERLERALGRRER